MTAFGVRLVYDFLSRITKWLLNWYHIFN
jgi:hypothetical protein